MGVFDDIYHNNGWADEESVSGPGSNLKNTEAVRAVLPRIFSQYNVVSLLDIPCGDFHWMKEIKDLPLYIGGDIVTDLIAENKKKYPDIDFRVMDIVKDPLPTVDLVIVRDLFIHLPIADIKKAIKNIRASGSTYLLSTTYIYHGNSDVNFSAGYFRPINLDYMFGLLPAIEYIDEHYADERFSDKQLGLWKIN